MRSIYVSITGFRINGWRHLPLFWWLTLRSLAEARRADGNLHVEARFVNGVYHTLTVWSDTQAMHTFLKKGAHFRAIKAYRSLGTGRTFGFLTHQIPGWDIALKRWATEGKDV